MSKALVERLNAAEIALRDDRPYAAVAIGEAADRIEALERENAECRRRNEEMDREITGLRNSYWEERKAHLAAEAREARLSEALRWAHDTLYEINISNYDHEEVCRLNDASVEVILGLAQMLGEKHGKTDEWWAEYKKTHPPARAALSGSGSGWRGMDSAPETGFFLAWSPDFPDKVSCWKAEIFHQARKPGTPRHLSANHFTLWRPLDLPAAPQQGGE